MNIIQFFFKVSEPRSELATKPMKKSKVDFIDTMHVPCNNCWLNGRGIAIPDIEHEIAFMFVRPNEFRLQFSIDWEIVQSEHPLK